jgi:hypothetical protein
VCFCERLLVKKFHLCVLRVSGLVKYLIWQEVCRCRGGGSNNSSKSLDLISLKEDKSVASSG